MASIPYRCGFFNNNSEWIVMSDTDYAAVELYNGYSDKLLMIASVCGVICMIIGIPGNLITIIALANYKKVRNATAIFIINMACADLLILCLDPPLATSIHWARSWTHGRVSCQLYALGKCLLIAVSVFTVLAITINRYILIIYPRLYCKIYRTRNLIIMLATIWICPLLALIPTFLGKWGCFALDLDYNPCSVLTDQNNRSTKKFLIITVLVLPCIPIILCYSRIFFVVRKTMKKSRNTAKKVRCSNFEETIRHGSSSINTFPAVTSNDTEEKTEYIPLGTIAMESEYSKELTLETPSVTNYNKDEEIPESTEQPRIQRKLLKKSMRFLKFSLPRRKDKRLGTMILAIITTFCVCHFLSVITVMLHGINLHPKLNIAAQILLWVSYCLNPIVYVVMSNEYQKAYKNLFKCQINIKNLLTHVCGLNRALLFIKDKNIL